jgi:hypothetical protein
VPVSVGALGDRLAAAVLLEHLAPAGVHRGGVAEVALVEPLDEVDVRAREKAVRRVRHGERGPEF